MILLGNTLGSEVTFLSVGFSLSGDLLTMTASIDEKLDGSSIPGFWSASASSIMSLSSFSVSSL